MEKLTKDMMIYEYQIRNEESVNKSRRLLRTYTHKILTLGIVLSFRRPPSSSLCPSDNARVSPIHRDDDDTTTSARAPSHIRLPGCT